MELQCLHTEWEDFGINWKTTSYFYQHVFSDIAKIYQILWSGSSNQEQQSKTMF